LAGARARLEEELELIRIWCVEIGEDIDRHARGIGEVERRFCQ
jgi:hypothetical protein